MFLDLPPYPIHSLDIHNIAMDIQYSMAPESLFNPFNLKRQLGTPSWEVVIFEYCAQNLRINKY